MTLKRKKFMAGLLVILLSLIGILLSDGGSHYENPFQNPSDKQSQSFSGEVQGVTDESVLVEETELVPTFQGEAFLSEGAQIHKVVKVVDGDTLDVDMGGESIRVRVIGIDTPETVDPRKSVQCFGRGASQRASEILKDQYVALVGDPTQDNKDKYSRLLRYVYLGDGTDYGLSMISQGYAHEYTYKVPYEHQVQYQEAQSEAFRAQRGLWNPSACNK